MTLIQHPQAIQLDQPLDQAFATFNELFARLNDSYQGLERQMAAFNQGLAESKPDTPTTQDSMGGDTLHWMAGIAHQIRSPLTAATLYAAQIKQCADAQRRERLCTRLIAGLEALSGQLDELLQLAGGVSGEPESFVLGDFIQSLQRQFEAEPDLARVQLHWQCSDPDQTFTGKKHALIGAVDNLIRNAIQAHSRRIECVLRLEPGDRLVITVRDNGQGLDRERMEAMFQPYCTTRSAGNGLGLAIARQIAHAHGGDLRCRESSAAGSVFEFQLPITAGPNLDRDHASGVQPQQIRSQV